jgi:hypothetical protein
MNHELEGKNYRFEDGNTIEVIQVKLRDEGKLYVHYLIKNPSGMPKKLIMEIDEFIRTFGHLFKGQS